MEWLLQFYPALMLIFCRITAFFVTAPIFSSRNVPVRFKVGFSFFLTLLALSYLDLSPIPMDGLYILSLIKETTIGLLLGFVAYLFFTVVQIAGSFMDMQIGFSMANIVDPLTGTPSPILGNFKFMLASLFFLTMDGHHVLIQGIIKSYNWVPLDNDAFSVIYNGQVNEFLVSSLSKAFGLALQMSAPLVISLFLVDVGLGILAKVAPQFNVFVIGIPLKMLVGLLLLLLLVTSFQTVFRELFTVMFNELENLMRLLSSGSS